MIYQSAVQAVVAGLKAIFVMHLGGADVAIKGGVFIKVEVDFVGASQTQLLDCCVSSQGFRVKLQAIFRKLTVAEIRNLELNGYKCKFTDIWGVRQVAAPKIELKTLADHLNHYTDIEDFISAIKSAGWLELATEKAFRTKHIAFHKAA